MLTISLSCMLVEDFSVCSENVIIVTVALRVSLFLMLSHLALPFSCTLQRIQQDIFSLGKATQIVF